MTVSELIKALQEVEDQESAVTVESAGAGVAAALGVITVTAGAGTFEPDAPDFEYGASGPAARAAGTVALSDV